jgi:hypothetical protein
VTGDEERCVVCGDEIVNGGGWTAHWGGPGNVVIVAWTCSAACTAAHAPDEAAR